MIQGERKCSRGSFIHRRWIVRDSKYSGRQRRKQLDELIPRDRVALAGARVVKTSLKVFLH